MKLAMIFITLLLIISTPAISTEIIPFSSPENSYSALQYFLEQPTQSLKLATYTFSDNGISQRLKELEQNGVDVKILLDKSPVGEKVNKKLLCWLESNGVEIKFHETPGRYMHAKYIISDESNLLVITENIGNSGYPHDQDGNRGWGAIVINKNTASAAIRNIPAGATRDYVEVFNTDFKNGKDFNCNLETFNPKLNQFSETNFNPEVYDGNIKTFFAPETAVESIQNLISSANESIYIEQFYIHPWGSSSNPKPNPFLEAAIARAEVGIETKILVDSSYYNMLDQTKSNLNTINYVNSKNLSTLEARPIDLDKLNLKKIHAKVAIIDNKIVMVSSVNWNENSPTNNRESGIIIDSEETARYFIELFEKDWGSKITYKSQEERELGTNIFLSLLALLTGAILAFTKKK